jgi:seryl-tRNA synthetase
MLDSKLLRENPELVREATRIKGIASADLVERWLEIDANRRSVQTRADAMRAEQNRFAELVGKLKRELKGETSPELEAAVAKGTKLKAQQQILAEEQVGLEATARTLMLELPAVPDPSWPIGKDSDDNVLVRSWEAPGRPKRTLGGSSKDHVAIGRALDIIDFTRSVKLAGARSYVLRGQGAELYSAVLRYAEDLLATRGYEPFVVPVLVTEQCMLGTGYFSAGREQTYATQDGSVLVGTSEVPLAGFFADEILEQLDAPLRLCARSTCFRREAGAAGKDTTGLYRVHQFDKVEQVILHRADEGEHILLHEEMIANAEMLLQNLELPYRVVKNSTGDMGQGKWRMYDIETWMPSRNAYGETHSGSALRDFQARRLNLRYRQKAAASSGKSETPFCYTLNCTAIACPRALIALLEQYQNEDGSVTIPHALRPYMRGRERIEGG